MSAAVFLHPAPVGSGPGAVRLPAADPLQRQAQERLVAALETINADDDVLATARSRVVSPSVDLPEETCPDCEGEGRFYGFTIDTAGDEVVCSACGGKGTITRLWHAVEQWRFLWPDDSPWLSEKPAVLLDSGHERRLVVVGYSDTQQVEVQAAERGRFLGFPAGSDALVEVVDDAVYLWSRTGRSKAVDVTAEPWAQGLVPGDRVLRWESVVLLDTPITEMVCPNCKAFYDSDEVLIGRSCEMLGCMAGFLPSGRIPLQLAPGFNPSVELAR